MNDMTKGSIWRKLFPFALPIIFSMLTQQLYNVVDTIIVGQYLGANQLGAVGNAGNIVIIAAAVSGGIELGSSVVLSGFAGKKDFGRIGRSTGGILFTTLFSAIILGVLGITFCNSILSLMNIPQELVSDTKTYMLIYLAGMFGIFLFDVIRSVILSLGKSTVTFILVLISSVLNVVLDLIFVCGLNMGVAGAAWATIISQFVGMIIAFAVLKSVFKNNNIKITFSKEAVKDVIHVLKISVPNMVQQFAGTLSITLLQVVVNGFGTQIISGYTVTSKLLTLVLIPIFGLAQSESVFVAQNIGADELIRVRKSYKTAIKGSLGYAILLSIVMLLFVKNIAGIFIDIDSNPLAFEFISEYLKMSVLCYGFAAWRYINEGYMRGCELMNQYLVVSLVGLAAKVIFSWCLSGIIGSSCFWVGNLLGMAIACILSFIFLNITKKTDIRILKLNPR